MTKLEALRIERGLSREKLARLLDMTTANVNNLCIRGSGRPRYAQVLRLSEILGVGAAEVVELLAPEVGAESKAVE